MRSVGHRKIRSAAVGVTGALVIGLAGYAMPAAAAPAASAQLTGVGVSPEAALGTPELTWTGAVEDKILQMVQCGGTMYAVGKFQSITQGGVAYPRDYVFSFSATSPYAITPWAPAVNGQVNSIAFNGTDCSRAYIGGQFTSVSGTAVSNLAEINTTTGAVVTGFGHSVTGPVDTLLGVGGHLIVGGNFIHINGSKEPYMASLNPGTGQDDGFIHLNISGFYQFCNSSGRCAKGNHSEIDNQQLSHHGTLDLVEGRFTSVGGKPRQQIFMLNLATTPATVTGWTSPEFDGSAGNVNMPGGYPYQCWFSEAWYIQSAAWSPDDSTVYIADTGYHPWNLPTGSYPRTGLCDAAAAFPATQTSVTHNWVEYSGCDSYYSVAADTGAVYVAGHPRWADNPDGCDSQGPGGVPDKGLQGLSPATGHVELNSGGTALYTMTRANASNMLITSAGLWIGSTNRYKVNTCGDLTGPAGQNAADHAGICLLPYTGP